MLNMLTGVGLQMHTNLPSLWSNVKAPCSFSNPKGRDYSNRLYHCAEFRYNALKNRIFTSSALVNSIELNEIFTLRFESTGTFSESNLSEEKWIKERLLILFENYSLEYLKSTTI